MEGPKEATEATRAAQARVAAGLPADDGQDFADAARGLIEAGGEAIRNPGGRVVWDMGQYAWQGEAAAPDSVNPSLWRQARLNNHHGLYQVCEGIYQVRGFDISNVTFVEGEKGLIVIDPLTSSDAAAAALALMRKHRGERPVSAVIYTHSHVDHYGGIMGVVAPFQLDNWLVDIIAPEGFLAAAASENVMAGNAMNRRAMYMYGALLPRGPKGHVDSGLGKGVSMGQVDLVAPTVSIATTGQEMVVDGVEIVFQVTPDTEAPAEMNFLFPRHGALCMAENCSCHLHNLYTPRGAQVRDAAAWSRYIDEAIDLFAPKTEVLFASHHWPKWGRERAERFLAQQRDLYKFIHDQVLRMANQGMTALEIGEALALPPSLAAEWHTRGYYGTLNHNAKAVYQKYLGWFDANPANLHRHPPVEAGRRYVDLAGGAEALLGKAREAYASGDYRWTAEVVSHLVFADPANEAARNLEADALEQMGYQAESGPWRDFYLTGAQELRNPISPSDTPRQGSPSQYFSLPAEQLLQALSVRLNGERAAGVDLAFHIGFNDGDGDSFEISVGNAVMHVRRNRRIDPAKAYVSCRRSDLVSLVFGMETLEARLANETVKIERDDGSFATFLGLLDRFDLWFPIVTP
jgi:alkyl sulfatase BDS1-like metallo-beta-lactamase superfamily hydrolase